MDIASLSLKVIKSLVKYVLIVALAIIVITPVTCMMGMHPRIGWFPESNFNLSSESRLPGWFSTPEGYDRKEVTVKIYYFVPPFGDVNFKTELIGPSPEKRVLDRKYGESKWHPVTMGQIESGEDHYPSFHIVNVEGIAELVEHRWRGPTFFVSDDPGMKETAGMETRR